MTYKWFTFKLTKKRQRYDNATYYGNREPLDHPALSRMTLAQLADLPIPSYVKESYNGVIRVN